MKSTSPLPGLARAFALIVLALAFALPPASVSAANDVSGDVDVESAADSWWDGSPWVNPDRGFNWYPPDSPPRKKTETPPPPKDIRALKTIKEVREELNRLRDVAIMTPTEQNIYAYLDANQFVMDKSSMFADQWRRVVWKNPEIDYNTRNPQANFAQTALKDIRKQERSDLMANLANTHGILFFYRSDCNYCKMQAPIIKFLHDKYDIEVLSVSLDGGPIAGFPDARPDNGISLAVTDGKGIDVVPATFLVSKDLSEVVALGAGVISMDEIVERIHVLTETQPGESF